MLCIILIIFVLGLNRETFALQLFCELFVSSKQSLVYALSTDCWFVIHTLYAVGAGVIELCAFSLCTRR